MKLSEEKINKIKEEILSVLFRNSPKAMFTLEIADAIIRDKEFAKKLLIELEEKKLVARVVKNNSGIDYTKRIRWRLTNVVYDTYSKLNTQKIEYDEKEHTYA